MLTRIGIFIIRAIQDMARGYATKISSVPTPSMAYAHLLVVVLKCNDQHQALCVYGIPNVTNVDVAESGPFIAGETF